MCYDVGVVGPTCSVCNTNSSYEGNADNFCFYELSVGFVYTLDVSEPREREGFYLTVPGDDNSLRFEFNIESNPRNQEVIVQLFLGRASENFWVLANLTEPIKVTGRDGFSRDFDDRSGDRNTTEPRLFSFAHSRLRNTPNFTELFYGRTENDYTNSMWDGDVALIVHVSNLSRPLTYKITLDQTNLWFLLYFFATFVL
jgi:Fanconi anemia group I protein